MAIIIAQMASEVIAEADISKTFIVLYEQISKISKISILSGRCAS